MTDEIRNNETDEIRDETLRKAVASLPREIAPERDLWPGIAAQIAPHRNRFRPWSIAAGIACLIALGGIITVLSLHRQPMPATVAVRQPVAQPQPTAAATRSNERADMLAAAIRRSTREDPHTQAVLLTNLDLVETSITRIQQALDENPGNPGLQPLLYQQYRNEATLVAAAQQVQLQTATGVLAP